jgi:NAD(P)-dependent dehydrogenase (short-subunit alcohol dehydrogenase family)
MFYARALGGDGIKANALVPGPRRTGLNATAASDSDSAKVAVGAVRLHAQFASPRRSVSSGAVTNSRARRPA